MAEENLKDKYVNLSEISILSAHDVDEKALADFYSNNPLTNSSLIRNWKWKFYSTSLKDEIPLVMVCGARVIAHIGLMPFEISYRGCKYKAAWLTDISILQEFQNRGAGLGRKLASLTKKILEFSDLSLGISNEAGINFLKHFGWIEFPESYFHTFPLLPISSSGSAPFLRKALGGVFKKISSRLLKIVYEKHAVPAERLYMSSLNQDTLGEFLSLSCESNEGVVPLRSADYANWRLMQSPDREKYRVAGIQGGSLKCVIKLKDSSPYRYIDMLWISNQCDLPSIKTMISSLAVWGIKNNYATIRFYTSHKTLSDYLKKTLRSILTRPRFNFYVKDKALLEQLRNTTWNWQLIDSDFESF